MKASIILTAVLLSLGASSTFAVESNKHFNRIASFSVCSQIDVSCNTDVSTSAEIVAVGPFGRKLVYTDSPMESVGFVNIADPSLPKPLGILPVGGEPTSVSVKGKYALVGVNSSVDYVNVSGHLSVVSLMTQRLVHTLDLGGQPDSVAVSPSKRYAAVVIENERDEDLGDGAPPQAPAGALVIVDISHANPKKWRTRKVDLTGLAGLYPGDPEPEFVDINDEDVAVVTLQENNHLVLVDLKSGKVIKHFSAGTVDLDNVDTKEEEPALIDQTASQRSVPREPDGVAWINSQYFATADEGDLVGGSRGFTIFNTTGDVVYSSGSELDHWAARLGHYPDARSANKGNEPENVEVGTFDGTQYLFVNSERSSLVFVYNISNPIKPVLHQILPAGKAPEGGLAIPHRNLLVVASEEDNREDKLRSVVNIYEYQRKPSAYPTLMSADRDSGVPIPWGAMSGLSAGEDRHTVYAVDDSFYGSSRIFTIDTKKAPALIRAETFIVDSNDVLANFVTSGEPEAPNAFDAHDLLAMINSDKTVNIDAEGVSLAADGGFWVASEGAGTIGDTDAQPIQSLNFLFKLDEQGVIERVLTLPKAVNDIQVRFGFEGVSEYNGKVYLAFQRAWTGDENPRIGIFDLDTDSWSFVFYPLDPPESQNGGWVGLSDITSLGDGKFLVLERDDQSGLDAAIKRLYEIDLSSVVDGEVITKAFTRDLLPDLKAAGGLVPEKIEGLAVMTNGDILILNDNDGVDDNSGETQLIRLEKRKAYQRHGYGHRHKKSKRHHR